VRAELFHVDRQMERQTDRESGWTKLIDDFRNFTNASKTESKFLKNATRFSGSELLFGSHRVISHLSFSKKQNANEDDSVARVE
jgi:hypothetical protein